MTPDNASAAQRDQFEAAMRKRGWTDYDFERDENGYGFHDSRLAWFAWQAAHEQGRLAGLEEAAQVCEDQEEPAWYGYENPNNFDDGKRACASAIRAIAAPGAGKEGGK